MRKPVKPTDLDNPQYSIVWYEGEPVDLKASAFTRTYNGFYGRLCGEISGEIFTGAWTEIERDQWGVTLAVELILCQPVDIDDFRYCSPKSEDWLRGWQSRPFVVRYAESDHIELRAVSGQTRSLWGISSRTYETPDDEFEYYTVYDLLTGTAYGSAYESAREAKTAAYIFNQFRSVDTRLTIVDFGAVCQLSRMETPSDYIDQFRPLERPEYEGGLWGS